MSKKRTAISAKERAHFDGYVLGVLHAVEFAQLGHGSDTIACELVTHVLAGVPLSVLKTMAREQSVEIDWTEIARDLRRHHRAA